MSFLHPTHPLRHHRMSRELLILLVVSLLFILAILVINLIRQMPQERAVPAPVIASPSVPVHFSKLQGSTSITEVTVRPIPHHLVSTPLQSALQQLLAGPTPTEKEAGYYSEIPHGTRLLGVNVQDNVVHINLSKEFTSGGGSTSMIQRVEELKTTVAGVEGNRKIELAIEGKPLHVLGGEGLEIN